MYILGLIFNLYCFIKFFFYGIYEIEELKNIYGGIIICIISIISLLFSSAIILYFYVI